MRQVLGQESWSCAALPTISLTLSFFHCKIVSFRLWISKGTSNSRILCLTQAWGIREAFLEEEAFEVHHPVRVSWGAFRTVEGSELIANLVCSQNMAQALATMLALGSKSAHPQDHAEALFRPHRGYLLVYTLDCWPLGNGGCWFLFTLYCYPV